GLPFASLPGPAWSRPTIRCEQPRFLRIKACQIASRGPPFASQATTTRVLLCPPELRQDELIAADSRKVVYITGLVIPTFAVRFHFPWAFLKLRSPISVAMT